MRLLKIITCLTFLVMNVNSYGQGLSRDNYKQQAQKNAEGMKGGLKLTDAQAREVKAIEEKFFAELLAPDRDSAQLEARGLKIERLQKQKDEALQKVFTPEQWKLYVDRLAAQKRRQQEAMEERKRKTMEKPSSNG